MKLTITHKETSLVLEECTTITATTASLIDLFLQRVTSSKQEPILPSFEPPSVKEEVIFQKSLEDMIKKLELEKTTVKPNPYIHKGPIQVKSYPTVDEMQTWVLTSTEKPKVTNS